MMSLTAESWNGKEGRRKEELNLWFLTNDWNWCRVYFLLFHRDGRLCSAPSGANCGVPLDLCLLCRWVKGQGGSMSACSIWLQFQRAFNIKLIRLLQCVQAQRFLLRMQLVVLQLRLRTVHLTSIGHLKQSPSVSTGWWTRLEFDNNYQPLSRTLPPSGGSGQYADVCCTPYFLGRINIHIFKIFLLICGRDVLSSARSGWKRKCLKTPMDKYTLCRH